MNVDFDLETGQIKSLKLRKFYTSITLIANYQVFREVAYRARRRQDLLAGIDEFLDQVTVLPPGEWDPNIRIEPPASVPSQVINLLYFTSSSACCFDSLDYGWFSQALSPERFFVTFWSFSLQEKHQKVLLSDMLKMLS